MNLEPMRNRNLNAIILGVSLILATYVYARSQRFTIILPRATNWGYKLDRATGKVWIENGDSETPVKE
jgi:hypothetical protein